MEQVAAGGERSEAGDSDHSEQDEGEDVFEVERIIDMRVEEGEVLYRVRWKNYNSDQDTWEPETHLEDCPEVLLTYKRKLADIKAKRDVAMKLPTKSDLFGDGSDREDHRRQASPPAKKKKKKKKSSKEGAREPSPDSHRGSKKKEDKKRRWRQVRVVPAPESEKDSEEEGRSLPAPPESQKRVLESRDEGEAPVPPKKHKQRDEPKDGGRRRKEGGDGRKRKDHRKEPDSTEEEEEAEQEGSANAGRALSEAPWLDPPERSPAPAKPVEKEAEAAETPKANQKTERAGLKPQGVRELVQEEEDEEKKKKKKKRRRKSPSSLPTVPPQKDSAQQRLKKLMSAKGKGPGPAPREAPGESSDSSDTAVKRKSKSKEVSSSPSSSSTGAAAREDEARPDTVGGGARGRDPGPASSSSTSLRPAREEGGETSLFEKFLLNCEAKDRVPRRQTVHTAPLDPVKTAALKAAGKQEKRPKHPKEQDRTEKAKTKTPESSRSKQGPPTQEAVERLERRESTDSPTDRRGKTDVPAERGKTEAEPQVKREELLKKREELLKKTEGSKERREGSKERLEGSKEKREGSKEKREGSKEKREGSKERLEGSKEKREGSKEKREGSKERWEGSKEKREGSKERWEGSKEKREGSKERMEGSKERREGSQEKREESKERREESKERREESKERREVSQEKYEGLRKEEPEEKREDPGEGPAGRWERREGPGEGPAGGWERKEDPGEGPAGRWERKVDVALHDPADEAGVAGRLKGRRPEDSGSPPIGPSDDSGDRTPDRGQASLNLGVDLKLDWMTMEDFEKHLNGEDEIVSAATLSPSELRDAVKTGNYLAVKLALNSQEEHNLDQEDSSGMSLAMLAAAGGQDDILRQLVKKGVKVNGRQKNGTTALMHAAEKNFLTTAAILLEVGAYVNAQTLVGETALMKACKRGNADVVRLLLEYGADCNILSKHQNNALHFAKLSNNMAVYDFVKDHMNTLSSVAEDTIRAYFETRLALLEPVFPLACYRLCDGPDFSLDFSYKPPPHSPAEGSGVLLFVFHANFLSEITARLCGPCSVHAVVLNDKFQLPIFLDSHFIYSFSPVPGQNKLFIRLAEAPTAKVKLLICAYRVQLQ